MHEILNFALNFHVVAFPWGNFLDIFQNFGNCLWAKFTRYVEIVLFILFCHCKNHIHTKFHVHGTDHFLPIYQENTKSWKRSSGRKIPSGPQAKFSRYGWSFFFFFSFSIVKTTFVPNFMYIRPFFPHFIKKNIKP